jgi:hypothetical protein
MPLPAILRGWYVGVTHGARNRGHFQANRRVKHPKRQHTNVPGQHQFFVMTATCASYLLKATKMGLLEALFSAISSISFAHTASITLHLNFVSFFLGQ